MIPLWPDTWRYKRDAHRLLADSGAGGWQPIHSAPWGLFSLVANLTTGPHRIRKEMRDPHTGEWSKLDWNEYDVEADHFHALPGLPK